MLAKPIGPGHSPALVKQARVRAHALSTTREAMLSRERPAVTFDQPAGAAFELGLGGDAATGRLVAHIANRTVPAPSVGAVRAIDAADAALNELGAAHLGAVSDPLHVGVAALGRIERALDTLLMSCDPLLIAEGLGSLSVSAFDASLSDEPESIRRALIRQKLERLRSGTGARFESVTLKRRSSDAAAL